MTDGRDRYLAERVNTASPSQLIKMLLDRLLVELELAQQFLGSGQRPEASPHILRAQDIVGELRCSLNSEAGTIAVHLDDIYAFCYSQLIDAHLTGDASTVQTVSATMAPIHDAWTHVSAPVRSAG